MKTLYVSLYLTLLDLTGLELKSALQSALQVKAGVVKTSSQVKCSEAQSSKSTPVLTWSPDFKVYAWLGLKSALQRPHLTWLEVQASKSTLDFTSLEAFTGVHLAWLEVYTSKSTLDLTWSRRFKAHAQLDLEPRLQSLCHTWLDLTWLDLKCRLWSLHCTRSFTWVLVCTSLCFHWTFTRVGPVIVALPASVLKIRIVRGSPIVGYGSLVQRGNEPMT